MPEGGSDHASIQMLQKLAQPESTPTQVSGPPEVPKLDLSRIGHNKEPEQHAHKEKKKKRKKKKRRIKKKKKKKKETPQREKLLAEEDEDDSGFLEGDEEEEGLSPEDIEALKREMNTHERGGENEEEEGLNDGMQDNEGGGGWEDLELPPEGEELRPWRGYGEAPTTSSEERNRKIKALRRFDRLERNGEKFYAQFSMRDELEDMEEILKDYDDERKKERGRRISKKVFVEGVKHLEKGSILFGPEWLNLYGWSQDVEDDIDTYEEPLLELYNRFKTTSFGDSPVFQICFMLALSASTHAAFNERKRPPTYWQRKKQHAIEAKRGRPLTSPKNFMRPQPKEEEWYPTAAAPKQMKVPVASKKNTVRKVESEGGGTDLQME